MNLETPPGRFGAVAVSFIVFFAAFVFFYPRTGLSITFLGIIPILLGAWIYGIWAGLLFTFILYGIDILFIVLLRLGNPQAAFLPIGLPGLTIGIMISLIMGWLGARNHKYQAEFLEHATLLEERTNSSRFLTLLNEILSAAMEMDDTSAMLEVLANRTGKLFNADHCFISFWDEKLRKTIPMAAYGSQKNAFFSVVSHFGNDERSLTAAILDTGHAIAIENIKDADAISKNVAEKFTSGSVLGLPLISGTRKLGAAILGFDELHWFTKEEIEHAELAVRQVSLAVTKALFLDEARKRVNELAGLNDISKAFSLHGDPHQTFGLLTETLSGLMGVKVCFITLYDPAGNKLLPQSPAHGLDEKQLTEIPCSQEPEGSAWNFCKLDVFCANSTLELPTALVPLAETLQLDCILAGSLWDTKEHLLGVIFTANKPGGFSIEDINMLRILSGQVTAVIQNVRLLNAERTRAEQLAVLHSVASAATGATGEDQLIEQVTLIIGQKLFSDSFGILLLDDSTQELYLHSSYRIGSHEGLARLPLGIGVPGEVARSGKPRRIDDAAISPDVLSLYPLTRSELCVPLKVESRMLGAVNAESTKANAFTAEDEELLTIIAGQLATAIQRLRTVQAERYQTQQLARSNSLIRALAQVNTRTAAAADPDAVLQTLGYELAKIELGCAIALSDDRNQNTILRYISLPERFIHVLESIAKIKIQDYTIPLTAIPPYSDFTQDACLVREPLSMLMSWVPGFPLRIARKFLKLIGLTNSVSICNLPLISDGKPIGILWVWGEGLRESDLPAMSLFASQTAAAIQNVNLLAEVGRLAITDELTGIFNRRHFFTLAEKQFSFAQAMGSHLSAMIVDLDHFKNFNDSYGHTIGDQVLRAVAQKMASVLRHSDIIGRYGGEEFSIILPETNNSAAIHLAERLISHIGDVPIVTEAGSLTIQLSIGIARMSKETPTLHSLIVRADQAMYIAKGAGRNRVAIK
jgi:diguanylate cyclase (GGDEF)-like protein